jgi:AAA15 family ATPase/GTPase
VLIYTKNNSSLPNTPSNRAFLALFQFVEKMVYIKTMNIASEYVGSVPETSKNFKEQIIQLNGIDKFMAFLNELGIVCQLEVYEGLESKRLVFVHKNRKIDFWEAASSGTRSLTLLYCWLERMNNVEVSFAYIDEFDAFYHQKLAKIIAKRISNLNSQTILSTHNTGIMSNDLLRPDCYFELKSAQIKPLYSLSDRELRKAHNLEKMYRAGAFDE